MNNEKMKKERKKMKKKMKAEYGKQRISVISLGWQITYIS